MLNETIIELTAGCIPLTNQEEANVARCASELRGDTEPNQPKTRRCGDEPSKPSFFFFFFFFYDAQSRSSQATMYIQTEHVQTGPDAAKINRHTSSFSSQIKVNALAVRMTR
jgi:hypothetical protein